MTIEQQKQQYIYCMQGQLGDNQDKESGRTHE